jgi:hypothetical protein
MKKKAAKKTATPTVKKAPKKAIAKAVKKVAIKAARAMKPNADKLDLFDLIRTTLKQTDKVLWERRDDEFTDITLDALTAALSWDITPAFWALFDHDSLFAQWYANTPKPSIFIRGDIKGKPVVVHLRSTTERNVTTGMPE